MQIQNLLEKVNRFFSRILIFLGDYCASSLFLPKKDQRKGALCTRTRKHLLKSLEMMIRAAEDVFLQVQAMIWKELVNLPIKWFAIGE